MMPSLRGLSSCIDWRPGAMGKFRPVAASPTMKPEGTGARTAPAAFSVLAERFDPEVIDVRPSRRRPAGVDGRGEWDAVISGDEMKLRPADHEREPDATIRADAASLGRDRRRRPRRHGGLPARASSGSAATSTSASASSPRRAASPARGGCASTRVETADGHDLDAQRRHRRPRRLPARPRRHQGLVHADRARRSPTTTA